MKIKATVTTEKKIDIDIELPFYCKLFNATYMKFELAEGNQVRATEFEINHQFETGTAEKLSGYHVATINSVLQKERYYEVITAEEYNKALDETLKYFSHLLPTTKPANT